MGFFDDIGPGLMGAGTGALSGFQMTGSPWGALAGGVLGGGIGALQGHGAHSAADAQKAALDDAMKRLQQFSVQQQQNRQQDLQKTMAFYGPADNYLKSIYAQPGTPTPGGTRMRQPPLTG